MPQSPVSADRNLVYQHLASRNNLNKEATMEFKLVGNKLTITCTVDGATISKSGKSMLVATTNGFTQVPGTDLKVSINVIKPRS